MATLFDDRDDAGRQLAGRLEGVARAGGLVVLGIPRGGVSVAFPVARKLQTPLDVFLARKLGVPGQEELAFGAISLGGKPLFDEGVIRAAGISAEQIARVVAEARATLERRAALYRGERSASSVGGRTVALVDDGIATGASMLAAVRELRELGPARLVVAVPVAPASTCRWLQREVDELVCLAAPEEFHAVGQFYRSFEQVRDEEVTALLRRADAEWGGGDAAR
jgi:putative phosphoribosyl transferase